MKFEWETTCVLLEDNLRTQRAKIFGGWVVRTECWFANEDCYSMSESSVFVPDPNHEWKIEK